MVTLSAAIAIAVEHHQAGRLAAAEAIYRRVLAVEPEHPTALHLLGAVLHQRGLHKEALPYLDRAVTLQPEAAICHNNRGEAYRAVGNFPVAIGCYERAVQLDPTYATAYHNLGHAWHTQGRLALAVDGYRQAIRCQPDYAAAYNNLGDALQGQGQPEEAIDSYHQALQLNPEQPAIAQNYLCALRYLPGSTWADLSRAAAEYERRHAAPLRVHWQPHANQPQPERPLCLGFVSPRLMHGPVGALLIRALEHLDRQQFRLTFYSAERVADSMTARFQAIATQWHDATPWNDEQLAAQIRADGVDILFDLAGHAPHNRLLAFARRPAPVQITWIDSVGPTGLAAMDYLLADRYTLPPEAEPYCTERVLRMPDGYICFEPPSDAGPVGPLPALERGWVTFGSFNNSAKIHRQVIELWRRILDRVPGSHLLLKYPSFDDPDTRRLYLARCAECGLAPERVEIRGATPYPQCLAEYGEIDIALDPFPHTGGLTTCDALWMGVPVITCPGTTFASRQSLSYLMNIGLRETVAGDFDEYVELAVRLAGDLPRLAELRAGLRSQMAASPLCDGARFAENLEHVLRSVWRRWCAKVQHHDS
jgi:protein O-GlcNAc transferase